MSNPRDRQILNSIVNPLLPLGEGVFDDEETLPDQLVDQEADSEEIRRSKELEGLAIRSCENGEMNKALQQLTEAIGVAPACYNNRAQVFRLLGNEDKAMEDLNKAIELSQGQGRSACQAFCQRGLLLRKQGHDEDALVDLKRSAELGNEFAKSLLVQLNPYAAMCNKMLKSMFQALEEGKEEVENPFKDVTQHQG